MYLRPPFLSHFPTVTYCYMPMAIQQAPPSPSTVKPFVLMPLAHGQFPLSQVHTTLANELNAMGNVA